MGNDISTGLVKVFASALQEHDPDYELHEGMERRPPLGRMLIRAARNALVLQLVSLFDEGLQEYLDAMYPNQRCDRLNNRIQFLKARGALKNPGRVEWLQKLRNGIAHGRDAFATWEDWLVSARTVHWELAHLGIVPTIGQERDWFPEES